jgi:hypothetical protein
VTLSWPTFASLTTLAVLLGWLAYLERDNGSYLQVIVTSVLGAVSVVGHFLPALLSNFSGATTPTSPARRLPNDDGGAS